jgi:hypothetical protein
MDHGMHGNSPRKSRWWPFSSSSPNDLEDDGSADDYASINQEWASKSEEDPFWWTQERNGGATGAGTSTAPKDTSWAKEGDRHVV